MCSGVDGNRTSRGTCRVRPSGSPGSTTGSLWVSENGGDAWVHVSAHLPPVHAVCFV
jgi:hypothetical protein